MLSLAKKNLSDFYSLNRFMDARVKPTHDESEYGAVGIT
jgi:hypothetical protein